MHLTEFYTNISKFDLGASRGVDLKGSEKMKWTISGLGQKNS